MKRLKQLLVIGLMVCGLGGVLAPVSAVYADASTQAACDAINDNKGCASSTGPDIMGIVRMAITILGMVVGIAAVIMIIVAGLKYVTSGGDSNAISSAKNTILYAIVGLLIVAMSQFVVQFVLRRAAAPSCATGQVLSDATNTCVAAPKK